MDFFNSLIINKENLLNNLKIVKNKAKNKKICAMVKANAYGHGLKNIVLSLRNYVDFFGVSNTEEALLVRSYSYKSKILLCSDYNPEKLKTLILANVSLTVFNLKSLKQILKASISAKTKACIHIKINTGMNRYGFKDKSSIKQAIKFIEQNKDYLVLEGIYTHLFCAKSKELSNKQYLKFIDFLKVFKKPDCINIHLENSVGLFNEVDFLNICNLVRVGISLYGLEVENEKLKPVLSLKSKIISVQKAKQEEFCGYGKIVLESSSLIGVVPIGYADGILKSYINNVVYINNVPCKILNICMDVILVDITNVNAKIGDEVEIISNDILKLNNANILAKNLNTISYEIITNLKHNRVNEIVE